MDNNLDDEDEEKDEPSDVEEVQPKTPLKPRVSFTKAKTGTSPQHFKENKLHETNRSTNINSENNSSNSNSNVEQQNQQQKSSFQMGMKTPKRQSFNNPLKTPHRDMKTDEKDKYTQPTPRLKLKPVTVLSNEFKERGNSLYSTGNYKDALVCYTKAIDIDKTNSIAYCNRAACYLMLGENEKASKDCITAIGIDPGYIRSYLRAGRSFLNQGYGNKAKSYYEKCLTLCEEKEQENSNIKEWKIECTEGISDVFYYYLLFSLIFIYFSIVYKVTEISRTF